MKRTTLLYHVLPAIIAIMIVGPLAWMATDRTPPQVRRYGELIPNIVERGGYVHVKFWTTKRARPDCPGTVQQEIVDSQNTIFSKLARAVGPVRWEPDPENPNQDIFYGHPVSIPDQAAPGPAMFRTVTFRYCNWLQQTLHWPIVQIGPDLPFRITLKPGEAFQERQR